VVSGSQRDTSQEGKRTKRIGIVKKRRDHEEIILEEEFREGLDGIKEGDYLWILYQFHKCESYVLKEHPKGDKKRERRGIFSLRGPRRPNFIGMSLVRVLNVDLEGGVLRVKGLDALDESPVIDLKPYSPLYDSISHLISGDELRELIERGIVSNLIDERQIQPNGIELTLESIYELESSGVIDYDNSSRRIPEGRRIEFEDEVHLPSGCYRIRFNEIVSIPKNIVAIARPRSSLLRSGATVETAVWDSGYRGRSEALLIIFNPHGLTLKKNARLIQLLFFHLGKEVNGYSGKYQNENL